MAFYSVKVNSDGSEIDSPRIPTFRETTFRTENVEIKKEVNSYVCKVSANPSVASCKTVTYINSAAFIEKPLQKTPKKEPVPANDPEPISTSNSNYDNEIPDNPYQSHIENDFSVPLLELKSNESYPSSSAIDYSYQQEVTKLICKPDAFKEWMDAKKMAKSYAKERKQKEIEKTQQEKEERRQLAEAKFQQWLLRKTQTKSLNDSRIKQILNISETNLRANKLIKKETEKRNFNAWLQKKIDNKKVLSNRDNENLRLERSLAQKRKDESEKLYQQWLVKAPERPKPVPLNKGFFTLKGTVSKIYVNPIPWQFENDTNSSSL